MRSGERYEKERRIERTTMNNDVNYTVYIDEAGDLGVNRGTKWFVISAVIVPTAEEPSIRATLSAIKSKFNLKDIHLRKMNDFYKTAYIISQVKKHTFTTVNILMDTDICPLKDSITTYNYMCRFLLERVSWFLRDNNSKANVVLSSRGTSRDGELIRYIQEKLLNYDRNQIHNAFVKIQSKSASSWDLLQLADICATSMFKAYEINRLGFITPCHASNLKDKMYRYKGKLDKYELKYYSEDMSPDKSYFEEHKLCDIK